MENQDEKWWRGFCSKDEMTEFYNGLRILEFFKKTR